MMERVCDMIDDEWLKNMEFYHNKRVFVTGHTGFKGAWLAAVLKFMGADAVGYALAPEPGGLYEKMCADELIHHVTGDLLDGSLLERTIFEFQPEIVFHLAAYGVVPECFKEPVRTYQTNLMGSTVLLEALRNCPSVKSIVLESADHTNKSDPYSISKACMEYMAQDYCTSYFQTEERMAGIAVVHAGNTLAEDSYIQAGLVSSLYKAAEEGNKTGLHNLLHSGKCQSVLDTLDRYMTVSRMLYEDPEACTGVWGILPRQEGTGWTRKLSDEEVIDQAVEFVKCLLHGEKEREICMRMIAAYYGAGCE